MIRRLLFGIGVLFVVTGVGLMGYIGWIYWVDQKKAQQFEMDLPITSSSSVPQLDPPDMDVILSLDRDFETQLHLVTDPPLPEEQPEDPDDVTADSDSPATIQWEKRPKKGEKLGNLLVESINVKIPIWEGTGDEELDKGVGRHVSLGLPGEADTVALAGHRETALRKAGEIEEGDLLVLETDPGTFIYQVRRTWITHSEDRSVVVNTGEPILRIYSCWPFEAGVSTDHRYVIEAELIG